MTLVDVTCLAFLGFGVAAGLTGCGGGSNATPASTTTATGGTTTPVTTPAGPTAAASVYVVQNPAKYGVGTGMILQFPATSNGSVSPTGMITGPTNTSFQALASDSSGDLYVTYQGPTNQGGLVAYAAGATASATPLRSLPATATTGVTAVDGIATTASGGIVVGEDFGAVQTFSATATGDVAPTYRITGASETGGGLSTLIVADAVAVDSSGNIFVANQGAPGLMPIAVFAPTATGNVAPVRTIGGALTTISGIGGMTVDSSGNLYVTSAGSTLSGSTVTYTGSILVFAPGASGNVAPIRTIAGSATGLTRVSGIKVDAVGNIYVLTSTSAGMVATATPAVLKFSATASGNVAPTSTFTSSAWTSADNAGSIAVY